MICTYVQWASKENIHKKMYINKLKLCFEIVSLYVFKIPIKKKTKITNNFEIL